MIDEKSNLIEGERALGRYTVSILQQTASGWSPAMLQLDAMATNYRLLLRPLRKSYSPASLPARWIDGIYTMYKGKHQCVGLSLTTSDWLYLLPSTGRLDYFFEDIRMMKLPPPRFSFDSTIARRDIERLITFFGREPRQERI